MTEADGWETVYATKAKREPRVRILVAMDYRQARIWCNEHGMSPMDRRVVIVLDPVDARRILGLQGPRRGADADITVIGMSAEMMRQWPDIAPVLRSQGFDA